MFSGQNFGDINTFKPKMNARKFIAGQFEFTIMLLIFLSAIHLSIKLSQAQETQSVWYFGNQPEGKFKNLQDAIYPTYKPHLSDKLSFSTYYKWKSKYGGLDESQLRRLKELEEENRRLKRMYADLSLDHMILKDIIEKNFPDPRETPVGTVCH